MKQVKLGFSLGFLSGTQGYDGVLESVIKHGANHIRVYEPFCKGWDTNLDAIVDRVQYLTKWGTAEVMICVSNLPYSWMSDYSLEELNSLTRVQKQRLTYTNRFFPKPNRVEEYKQLLQDLVQKLEDKHILDLVSFEVGNEPDAANYFWGTFQESIDLIRLRVDALKVSGRPIYIGDFTSSLMRDEHYKGKEAFMNYIKTNSIFRESNIKLSHSFYWKDSGGEFNTAVNSYPDVPYSRVISEYNMYTSFKNGSTQEADFNSTRYMNKFCEFLRFIYDLPVETVYIHPLCEFSNDETGNMGVYKKNYDSNSKTTYYTLKPSGQFLMMVIDTIRYGYIVKGENVVGRDKSIVFDQLGNWNLVNN